MGQGENPGMWQYVKGAAIVQVPRQIEGMGGLMTAVATVGIN